ncbi:hypothetical protein [Rhizobium sp. SL86]|uniref:hypothetical protein n=1 Tax=Rhizobium sp. SL86 TaxID=2995148 RepID=UPI002273620B|nr:hypothetical protein [Rhizobium sp. SL86]MCY1667582.1 hypothetical protein [Rhizobium sp. SL86]
MTNIIRFPPKVLQERQPSLDLLCDPTTDIRLLAEQLHSLHQQLLVLRQEMVGKKAELEVARLDMENLMSSRPPTKRTPPL